MGRSDAVQFSYNNEVMRHVNGRLGRIDEG